MTPCGPMQVVTHLAYGSHCSIPHLTNKCVYMFIDEYFHIVRMNILILHEYGEFVRVRSPEVQTLPNYQLATDHHADINFHTYTCNNFSLFCPAFHL